MPPGCGRGCGMGMPPGFGCGCGMGMPPALGCGFKYLASKPGPTSSKLNFLLSAMAQELVSTCAS